MIYLNQKIIFVSVVQHFSRLQINEKFKRKIAGGTLEPSAAVANKMSELVELKTVAVEMKKKKEGKKRQVSGKVGTMLHVRRLFGNWRVT